MGQFTLRSVPQMSCGPGAFIVGTINGRLTCFFTLDLMLLNQQQHRATYLVHLAPPPNGYTLLPLASLGYDFVDNPTKKVQHRVKAEELQSSDDAPPGDAGTSIANEGLGHEETCIMQQ
jgi:hypothetical protein